MDGELFGMYGWLAGWCLWMVSLLLVCMDGELVCILGWYVWILAGRGMVSMNG